jgi:hypothetical protein
MPELKDRAASYETSIFLNCPFDTDYQPIFDALIFTAYDCGYRPFCALEIEDGGQVRVEKIIRMIQSCRLGVHDISRTELDSENQLPRFNMPFELGLFVGAARFGRATQKTKMCLILDRERYRFQKFISDIAGQDIAAHKNEADGAIKALRNWLASIPTGAALPGGAAIVRRYHSFRSEVPGILAKVQLEADEVTFADYVNMVQTWLVEQPRPAR